MRLNKVGVAILVAWTSISSALAEVLVILPQSGNMARAGKSVQAGIEAAHRYYLDQVPLKFIDSDRHSVDAIVNEITPQTQLIMGPLDRKRLPAWLKQDLRVPLLVLNHIEQEKAGVYQFALSKQEDAVALTKRMQADGVQMLYVLQDVKTKADTQLILSPMAGLWGNKLKPISALPQQLGADEGVLLLGQQAWLEQTMKTASKGNYYASTYSVEQPNSFPNAVTLCDTASLYNKKWQDIQQLKQQESHVAYLRLAAFGADAWQVARHLLDPDPADNTFIGRTGTLTMGPKIQRQPSCVRKQAQGWEEYPI